MCLVRPIFLNYSVPPSDELVKFEFDWYGRAKMFLQHFHMHILCKNFQNSVILGVLITWNGWETLLQLPKGE